MRPARPLAGIAILLALCALGLAYTGKPASSATAEAAPDYESWAVDPTVPGSDLPPAGRSLFDHLIVALTGDADRVPFPFASLVERIDALLARGDYAGGTRITLIPMGRSLQRAAAAPDFFKFPRIVFAVTAEPAASEHDAGMLLKDRLYIGYVEKTAMLEVISYNEAAGRFEFQLVKDYRAGAQSKVFYANRAICMSCHQNHGPIFPRAIWGETNANRRLADLLHARVADFHLSRQANIDFADDIDKATLRANTLVTLQSVWQQGCADGTNRVGSQRCRAAALTAVLQYGLSGKHDFDADSPGYQRDFVRTLGKGWRERWPRGLQVAEPNLPDRNPLGGTSSSYAASGADEVAVDRIAALHVPAALDPLNLRPAREIWQFSGAMHAQPLISGWSAFFAMDDFQTLDAYLQQHNASAPHVVYRARCSVAWKATSGKNFMVECAGDPGASDAVHLAARFDVRGRARVEWLNFGSAGEVRELQLEGLPADQAGVRPTSFAIAQRNGLTRRLRDGRSIASIALRWPADVSIADEVTVEVTLVDDFTQVRDAIERLLAEQPSLFDSTPLARARIMPALFSELGMRSRTWCCVDDSSGIAPAATDPAEHNANAFVQEELQPFFRHCGTCHLTREAAPPNFLAGDAEQVTANLRQCAPRMLVRLAAWHTRPEQRLKSPMPPPTAILASGDAIEHWAASAELKSLRKSVEALARAQGQPTDIIQLVKDGYDALPRCLSTNTQ
jgi:hypothetical protein